MNFTLVLFNYLFFKQITSWTRALKKKIRRQINKRSPTGKQKSATEKTHVRQAGQTGVSIRTLDMG